MKLDAIRVLGNSARSTMMLHCGFFVACAVQFISITVSVFSKEVSEKIYDPMIYIWYGSRYPVFFPGLFLCKQFFCLYTRSSVSYLLKLWSIRSLNSKRPKQKGENLGERNFKGGIQASCRFRAISRREEGQKSDSVPDHLNNYKLSEYVLKKLDWYARTEMPHEIPTRQIAREGSLGSFYVGKPNRGSSLPLCMY